MFYAPAHTGGLACQISMARLSKMLLVSHINRPRAAAMGQDVPKLTRPQLRTRLLASPRYLHARDDPTRRLHNGRLPTGGVHLYNRKKQCGSRGPSQRVAPDVRLQKKAHQLNAPMLRFMIHTFDAQNRQSSRREKNNSPSAGRAQQLLTRSDWSV